MIDPRVAGSRLLLAVSLFALALGCGRSDPFAAAPVVALAPHFPSRLGATAVPAPEKARRLVVVAGGDVNLGRETGQRILSDPSFDPFAGIRPLLAEADVVFANLESPLSDQDGETRHPGEPLSFVGPPSGATLLARAPFDVVSLANNHAWDYGRRGFLDTLDHLEEARVAYVGASREPDEQYRARVVRRQGWSLAIIAATHVWNPGDFAEHEAARHVAWAHPEPLVRAVVQARSEHDVVLVSYHGGREYSEFPAREPIEVARLVMDAGADAVIAHHPHVPQGIGWQDGRPIFYSLGNLVFGKHRDHPWTARGFLARLSFFDGGLHVALCPYLIGRETPRRVDAPTGYEVFGRYVRRTSSFASVAGTETDPVGDGGCFEARPGAG